MKISHIISLLFFFVCYITPSYSQNKIIITRVRGDVASINAGFVSDIKKGMKFQVNRIDILGEMDVAIVEVVAVRKDIAAVKVVTYQEAASLEIGDILSNEMDVIDQLLSGESNTYTSITPRTQTHTNSTICSYSSISLGYGVSYGGLGAKFQYNFSNLAFHIGGGYYDGPPDVDEEDNFAEPVYLFSVGLKVYFSDLDYYINAQFGTIGIDGIQTAYTDGYSEWITETKQTNLYGPSLLLGYESLGRSLGFNFAIGGSVNVKDVEWRDENPIVFTADIGLIIRL